MRLIHTVPSVAKEASGPSYSVTRLCATLIERGLHVSLATLDWAPMSSKLPFLHTFPLGLGPRRLGSSPAMRSWLSEKAESREVDLFHNHSLWMMPNVYPGQVASKFGIPFVVSPRGVFTEYAMAIGSKVKPPFWRFVQKPALRAVSLFHATAESELVDIRRVGFRQPVAIIPNGIDIPAILPKKPSVLRKLLFLGRIHPNKGLDMLLPAWKVVENRFEDWQLVVIGTDDIGYLSQMQKLANDLSIKRIEFGGPLFGHAKWQAYADADIFILPSYSENFGMAVAEALASGIPAIVAKGAPWRGLETQGAGWWIDLGVDPLVACLEEAMAQPSTKLYEMGSRGREWMQSEFSWAEIALRMQATYCWILDGGIKPDWVIENY